MQDSHVCHDRNNIMVCPVCHEHNNTGLPRVLENLEMSLEKKNCPWIFKKSKMLTFEDKPEQLMWFAQVYCDCILCNSDYPITANVCVNQYVALICKPLGCDEDDAGPFALTSNSRKGFIKTHWLPTCQRKLVAQRVVIDAVRSQLGSDAYKVHKVNITKQMMTSCSAARIRYEAYIQRDEKEHQQGEMIKKERALQQEVTGSSNKKLKLEHYQKMKMTSLISTS